MDALPFAYFREQLIPMLGLAAIEGMVHPKSTLDKLLFLFKYGSESHHLTVLISFVTLAILMVTRELRKRVKRLSRLPDVLLAVIITTSQCPLGSAVFKITCFTDMLLWSNSAVSLLQVA
jgi:MFS superfamily sulfate permease-like transporter